MFSITGDCECVCSVKYENPQSWKCGNSRSCQQEGNRLFKEKNYQKARLTYGKAIAFIPISKDNVTPYHVMGMMEQVDECGGGGSGAEENEDELTLLGKKLRGLLRSNLAMTELKLGRYQEALRNAEAALVIDPENRKASFRKGQALMYTGFLEKARKIFKDAAQADPQNIELRKALLEVDTREKAAKQKERKRFQGKLTKDGIF